MPTPHVSVIIPLYNGVEFLEECLDSVKQQTFTDWDAHIGVNGHGNDGGMQALIAKELTKEDPRFTVHVFGPEIKGKVQTLNRMMFETTGEWIALLDCDDKWEKTKLEKQILAKKGPARSAGVIGTQCLYFGNLTGSPNIPTGLIDGKCCTHANPIINSSALLHRSLCYWDYDGLEDYALWMRLSLANIRFYNISEPLTFHRIHAASAFNSKQQDPIPLRDWFTKQLACIKTMGVCPKGGQSPPL